MKPQYQHLLPPHFSPQSRVWIYQSSRHFLVSEALSMEPQIEEFVGRWQSHGAEVTAYGNLFFGQFLVLMADETGTGVSGCSTDASVRFVKEIGHQYNVDFFNRTHLAFFIKDAVQLLPLNQAKYALENGFINGDTLYFNNTVQTKKELEEDWIIPVKDSWLKQRLAGPAHPVPPGGRAQVG
jgi:hypothetical protein